MPYTFTIGDFVTVTSPTFDGTGEIVNFSEGLYAVAHDDDADITWHTAEEMESE